MELKFRLNLLKISYLFHFILLIIIILFNYFYKNNIIWIDYTLNSIFIAFIIILLLIAISPIIFFIILFIKNNYCIIFFFLKIGIGITILSIIIAIGIIILFYYININYPIFYKNCPFNYELSDIEKIFTDYIQNKNYIDNNKLLELKEKCENRRCIYQNDINDIDNIYKYSYICNYNSKEDFKDISEDIFICEKSFSKDFLESKVMLPYIHLCNSLVDFYLCNTTLNFKKYKISANYICPKENQKSVILEVIISLLNIFIPIAIFIIQFIYYKKILKLIVTMNIRRVNENENGNGGTVDTSKKTNLNNNNNSFKKEQTDLIIIENAKNEDEILNIYNKTIKNKRNISNSNNKDDLKDKTTTVNPFINNAIIKINKKNKEKILKIDEMNRSFNNSNSNYLNNYKINILDSKRMLTLMNKNEEKNNIELNKKENQNLSDDTKIKYILIKK